MFDVPSKLCIFAQKKVMQQKEVKVVCFFLPYHPIDVVEPTTYGS